MEFYFMSCVFCTSTGIKYFMATSGKQNCDSVCASFGLQCAGTGQSFPNSSALSIFESLGITCDTKNDTDYYFYKDQPNYISASPPSKNLQWAGRCTGFKAIPSTIDCYTANNDNVRRLCPCKNPSGGCYLLLLFYHQISPLFFVVITLLFLSPTFAVNFLFLSFESVFILKQLF